MKRKFKIALCAVCGIAITVLVVAILLICLGFRFTSKAAVHEYYRESMVIHTEEYDFYFNPVDGNDASGYSDGHVAVKRYGCLYKLLESDNFKYKERHILVAENGDTVGYMYSYLAKNKVYRLIHWQRVLTDKQGNESHYALKYWTDKIFVNDTLVTLQNNCFFTTTEDIDTLVIGQTNVFLVSSPY